MSDDWKTCGLSLEVAISAGFTEDEMQRLLAFLKKDRNHELEERLRDVSQSIKEHLIRDTDVDPFVPISPEDQQSAHGYFLLPLAEMGEAGTRFVLVLPSDGSEWLILRWRFYGVLMRWLSLPVMGHCPNTIGCIAPYFGVSPETFIASKAIVDEASDQEQVAFHRELSFARNWEAKLRMEEVNEWYKRQRIDCPVCDWPYWIIPQRKDDLDPETATFIFPVVDGSGDPCTCLISRAGSAELILSAGEFENGKQSMESGDWLAQYHWLQQLYEARRWHSSKAKGFL